MSCFHVPLNGDINIYDEDHRKMQTCSLSMWSYPSRGGLSFGKAEDNYQLATLVVLSVIML